MENKIQAGKRAPSFSFVAAGSARSVSLEDSVGRAVVLVFHLQGTASTAAEINRVVRARYPSSEQVLIASVVDLSFVPAVYWMAVGLVLSQAYEREAARFPPGADPAEYVLILPDYTGRVSRSFGVRGVGRVAASVVIDPNQNVVGFHQGGHPADAILRLLDGIEGVDGGTEEAGEEFFSELFAGASERLDEPYVAEGVSEEWSPEELRMLWDGITDRARSVLAELARRPAGYPQAELQQALGITGSAMGGTLSSVGYAMRRFPGKHRLYHRDPAAKVYTMPNSAAESISALQGASR